MRPMADLDLLVKEWDVDGATKLLEASRLPRRANFMEEKSPSKPKAKSVTRGFQGNAATTRSRSSCTGASASASHCS